MYNFFIYLQGKVEMEIELVSADEAKDTPVGQARDEPNQHPALDPPQLVYLKNNYPLIRISLHK